MERQVSSRQKMEKLERHRRTHTLPALLRPPGVFTAPIRGVYYVRFTANAPTDFTMSAVLYKNGQQVQLIAHEQPSGKGSDTASNGAALLLGEGDTLSMQLWHNTQIWDNSNHHSTFSGFLLFPM